MQKHRVEWRGVEENRKRGGNKGKMYEGSPDSVWRLAEKGGFCEVEVKYTQG